ncbi:hypothetical protein D3C77_341530 [compost metagenome]
MAAIGPGQPHGAHRFCRRTTIRPGHATDRHGKTRTAGSLGATHHGLDHLLADRSHLGKQGLGDSQLTGFLLIGIGHVTRLEPGRAARNPGNGLCNAAAGAGFGRCHLGIEATQVFTQAGRKRCDRVHGKLLERLPATLHQLRPTTHPQRAGAAPRGHDSTQHLTSPRPEFQALFQAIEPAIDMSGNAIELTAVRQLVQAP